MALAYRHAAMEQHLLLRQFTDLIGRLDQRLIAYDSPDTAAMIRELLKSVPPGDPVDDLDKRFRSWGEEWHNDEVVTYGPDDWVPAKKAGPLIQVQAQTVNRARKRGRLKGKWVSGKGTGNHSGWWYKVSDLYAFSADMKERGLHPRDETDTVQDNGSSDAK